MRYMSFVLGGAIVLALARAGVAQDQQQTNPSTQNAPGAYGNPNEQNPAGQGSPGMEQGTQGGKVIHSTFNPATRRYPVGPVGRRELRRMHRHRVRHHRTARPS